MMTGISDQTLNFDEPRFRRLAASRLLPAPASVPLQTTSPGDFDLNPTLTSVLGDTNPTPAAVLIPVKLGADLSVILTQRTAHLPAHAGQIAFPGGKIDPGDQGPLGAALREAEEEIGLAARFVEPLGYVESYRTGTGFLVTPVVAFVREGYSLIPNPEEVASVFEVPLAFLLDERNLRIDTLFWKGADRRYYAMEHEGRYIWGATAGIVRALHRRLFAT